MEDALFPPCILDDLPLPGPRIEMIYFCDGEGSVSTGLGEKVFLFPGEITVSVMPLQSRLSLYVYCVYTDCDAVCNGVVVVSHQTDSWQ